MCLMRILLIFLFLLPFAASSQTREETEAWIMSKADVRAYELGLHYRIEEGEMIQLIEPISVLVGVGSDIEKSIPLESVKTISYKHTDEFLSFVLKCEYRSEEHTSELQSLMRISYAVFCLKKKKQKNIQHVMNV